MKMTRWRAMGNWRRMLAAPKNHLVRGIRLIQINAVAAISESIGSRADVS